MLTLVKRHRAALLVLGSLFLGFALRLIWGNDIEFKADEAYSFERVRNVGVTESWPWVGMNSSVGLVNPGMAVWVFLGLGKIFSVASPPDLARAVAIMNCVALAVFAAMIFFAVAPAERRVWRWALALAAVNPLGVLLQRKIWSPSTLPLFSILLLWAWYQRRYRAGAFCWGLLGACLGQIHMGGFFYAAALAGWSWFFDRWSPTRWWAWVAGSVMGSLPMIPWLVAMYNAAGKGEHSAFKIVRLLTFKFYNYWVAGSFGVNLTYSLRSDFWDFLRYPLVAGYPTYLLAVVEVVLCVAMLWLLLNLARYWKQRSWAWRELAGNENQTSFLVGAGLWGAGLLMTVALVPVHNHYLLVFFPLLSLWLAQACLRFGKMGEKVLATVFVAQLCMSAGFLHYIHVRGGSPNGDYGTSYSEQLRREAR